MRRALTVSHFSYKFRSHLEMTAVALTMGIATAVAVPHFLAGVLASKVSEVHTITSTWRKEAIVHWAQTGRWPTTLPGMDAQEGTVGVNFDRIVLADEGVMGAVPTEQFARTADLGAEIYWLSPLVVSASDRVLWVCTRGAIAPTPGAISRRQVDGGHLPPTFCP